MEAGPVREKVNERLGNSEAPEDRRVGKLRAVAEGVGRKVRTEAVRVVEVGREQVKARRGEQADGR